MYMSFRYRKKSSCMNLWQTVMTTLCHVCFGMTGTVFLTFFTQLEPQ